MPNTTNAVIGTEAQDKPKFKLRKKHIKKAVTVTVYAFVAIVMVASMVTPLWMQ